jgi:hypothetical protein
MNDESEFEPQITPENVLEIEEAHKTAGWIRRAALRLLSQTESEIRARMGDEVLKALFDLEVAIHEYLKQSKAESDLLELALPRLSKLIGSDKRSD